MVSLISAATLLKENYLPLIKGRQTLLLTLTGIAGYLCQPPATTELLRFSSLIGSLLVTISGCTILNMLMDRDIDRKMVRTQRRPLATGQVSTRMALLIGIVLIAMGLLWSVILSMLYFVVILAGVGLNVLVYTLWLKRRSAWSILWGGVAGGMPILAGRALAINHIDTLGVLLALVIVCWIPSHNLTLGTLYSEDYLTADIPTFLSVYGAGTNRLMVTISSLLTAFTMVIVSTWLDLPIQIFVLLLMISTGLVVLAIVAWAQPGQKRIKVLYKYSSLYMLISMLFLALSGIV